MQWRIRLSEALCLLAVVMPAALVAQDTNQHWAYRSLSPTSPLVVAGDQWSLGDIDRFIFAAIKAAGQEPSRRADATTLTRRLFFDLTGLPPSLERVEALLATKSSAEGLSQLDYGNLVDQLLASPQFAERMAMYWLDLVRFADTTGVHADNPWDVHPYRDWVIQAFHDNMPFDQFTREQIAGDLLANATQSQRVAAAYNRLNLITREGGSQPKEFLVRYTADRVRNVSTVWLGATVGCAECHDHKFDPISARDFYRLGAFFADIEQVGVYSQGAKNARYFGPYLAVPTPEQAAQLAELDMGVEQTQEVLNTPTAELQEAQSVWERSVLESPFVEPTFGDWHVAGPYKDAFPAVHRRVYAPEQGVDLSQRQAGKLLWTKHPEWVDGKVHQLRGDHTAFYLSRTIEVATAQPVVLLFGSDDAIKVWVDGVQLLDHEVSRGVVPDQERLELQLAAGQHQLLVKISNGTGGFGFYFRADIDRIPDAIQALLRQLVDRRSNDDAQSVAAYFRGVTPLLADTRRKLATLRQEREQFADSLPVVLATVATKPMTTRVLPRGDWMNDTGEVVLPGVPAAFGALPEMSRRATRLDLANWLVSSRNTLVARVFVNRLWKLFFGRGIVRSLDDFGTQGENPTHPELLDYLALRFVQSGWDVKAMVRLMVTSAAYQQESACDEQTADADPYNHVFSRQARYRHDAEVIRDNALATSGLLVLKVGGRSVRPYQPEGFYQHLNFPKRRYQQASGEDLWRRSLYTHWQRQYLHPALSAFDAPSREECTVQRARSNTPLQALVLLNDPILVEAARVLATRMMREGVGGFEQQLSFAFKTVLSRSSSIAELDLLRGHHDRLRQQYQDDPAAAKALLSIGAAPLAVDIDPVELAAVTGVARVILSLHETLTRY